MTDLNAPTDRMVLIIDCKVKDADGFKTWSRDRAAKYVYDLKEENRDEGRKSAIDRSFNYGRKPRIDKLRGSPQ